MSQNLISFHIWLTYLSQKLVSLFCKWARYEKIWDVGSLAYIWLICSYLAHIYILLISFHIWLSWVKIQEFGSVNMGDVLILIVVYFQILLHLRRKSQMEQYLDFGMVLWVSEPYTPLALWNALDFTLKYPLPPFRIKLGRKAAETKKTSILCPNYGLWK